MAARKARFVRGPAMRTPFSAPAEPRERLVAVGAVGDDLREHRIVVRADDRPLLHAGIDADAVALRERRRPEAAGRRPEIGGRVLGIEPHLDGVAGERDLLLAERQRLARRDPELPFDEVEPGHRLRHRVLDLQARVHLHEEEAVAG